LLAKRPELSAESLGEETLGTASLPYAIYRQATDGNIRIYWRRGARVGKGKGERVGSVSSSQR
jgi:hypothetical protein